MDVSEEVARLIRSTPTLSSVPVYTGLVVEPDLDRHPQAMVESTTEWDYADLPDDLREDLKDWCQRFGRWADSYERH